MSNLKKQIEDLSKEAKAKGIQIPEALGKLSLTEQVEALADLIAEAALTSEPKVTDLGVDPSEKELAAMAEDMKAQFAQQLKELEELKASLREAMTKPQQSQAGGSEFNMAALEAVLQKVTQGKTNAYGMIREGYIPPEDVLSPPVQFFCNQQSEYLSFLPHGGLMIPPPNEKKMLRFINKFRWVVQTSTGPKVRALSTYVCSSKSEQEWIKKHPKFGRTIFVESEKAIRATAETEYVHKYNQFRQSLALMNDGDLAPMAFQHGIPTNSETHPDMYRDKIAEIQTEQYFADIKAAHGNEMVERRQDEELLRSAGITV